MMEGSEFENRGTPCDSRFNWVTVAAMWRIENKMTRGEAGGTGGPYNLLGERMVS